jgi:hypothetical protein
MVDREAEHRRAMAISLFEQLCQLTHYLAIPLFEQGVPREDWPPMLWGACEWLTRFYKDMTDHGKASFLPMPDSLVRELQRRKATAQ